MSNDNCNMPCENQAALFLAKRSLLLDVDGNYSSLSPDSGGCNFNLSERRDCSSPNNTAGTGGPLLQPRNDSRTRRLSTLLEASHIGTLDNGGICLWNECFSELSNQDTDEGMNSAAPSPDSVGMSSCGTSCRGSTDLSFSSEEMMTGSNSFVLEEQAVPSGLSSLAESPAAQAFSLGETMSIVSPLSEVEGTEDRVCSGGTFELGEKAALPCEENVTLFSSFSPVEKDQVRSTFLFEKSVADISCGEMVVRSNSFILEEQAVASVVSSYEESPSAKSHTESKLFLTPLSEKENVSGQLGSHPCFGKTFMIGDNIELPSEDKSLALPSERPSLHATFLCENAPADVANDAQFIHSNAEILNETYAVETPVRPITFNTPLSTVRDEDICTSTPLQDIGSNVPSLPSFAVSPCTEITGSPALRPVLRKRNPITPKQFERGGASGKVTKMEMSNFPKSALNVVKCKRNAESSSALLDKPSQINNNTFGSFRQSPIRNSSSTPSPHSKVFKAVNNSPTRQNSVVNKDKINLQKSPTKSEDLQIKCKTKTMAHRSAAHSSSASPGEGTSRQAKTDPKTHIANVTFCYPEESPQKRRTSVSTPIPEDMTDKINKVKLDKSASKTPNSSPCPSSETTVSRLLKTMKPQKLSSSFTLSKSKTEHLKIPSKPASRGTSSSRTEGAMEAMESSCRKVKKIGLVGNSKALSTASCSADTNARARGPLSPSRTGRASTSKVPSASPMTATPLNKQRPALGRDMSRATTTMGTPLSKQKNTGTVKSIGDTSLSATPSARTRPAPSQPPQTTPRSTLMGPPLTPVPRQQRKAPGSTSNHGDNSDKARTTPVSAFGGRRATPFKVPIVKPKFAATQKANAPVLTAACKSVPTTRGQTNSPFSPPKRTTTARTIRLSTPVDKGRPRAGACPPQPQQSERGCSRPQPGTGRTQEAPPAQIQHLQTQLAQSNHRFEALAVVLQQALTQRDEAVRQSRGRSQELLELRGELVHTVNRSESLAQEKEALKASLQEALEEVRAQHQRDLLLLEEKLREEHLNDTRAAQQQLREEQERGRERLQRQLEEISAAHESLRQDLEQSHSRDLQSSRQQHQLAIQELRDAHTQDLQALNKTLRDAETALNEKIQALSQENAALMERLVEEENKSRDNSQKDSHTLYLEQELESLKVVLDIKTEQLHQQEKKLMEVDKLTERNVKLGETLVKVQQENEDLKARMERHAALSRQLSTEQAQLQESLQKESKVNKRLSMENEELLWKLHNGDLSSPRKSSPNPPSPFSLGSPRTPTLFSTSPVSPR